MKTKVNTSHAPELYSITLAVHALEAGVIPLAHGYHVHALFLNIIRSANPALAEKLHADESVKPFTVSTLIGKKDRKGARITISTQTAFSLRLTFLDTAVFSHFIDGALKWGEKPVEIAGLPFRVAEVVTAPRNGMQNAFGSYRGILDNAGAARQLDMEFMTPTVFRSGGKRNNVFPEPALVFRSYWNRWQALSPIRMDDNLNSFLDKINVTRYRLETVIWDFGSYQEVGFSGACRFEIDRAFPEDKVTCINALADFAQFCGTGAKTTMGMGQTRRISSARFVSGRTGGNYQKERWYTGDNQR